MAIFGAISGLSKLSGQAATAGILGGAATEKFNKFFGGNSNPVGNTKPPEPDTGIAPLSKFISTIKNEGLAQTNNFTFTFTPPTQVVSFGGDIGVLKDRMLNLLCSSTVLPGVNLATQPIRYFGEVIEMPHDKQYDSLNSTFYVDGSMYVKLFFDRWIEYIQDPNSREFRYYDDYTTNILVNVFDKHGLQHYMALLTNAYPKSISAITLSHDSRELMKVDIVWEYRNCLTYSIPNSVQAGAKSVGTAPTPTLSQRLMGYAGQFKDYQNRFNNLGGDISRTQSLIKNGDFGGLVGQNTGGGWF